MTIPATNSQLLVTQDWTKIYQSFRNSDFQSYDFDTLRRTMIQYLQENYPEDFNDFIDSSEYIALIDLIAYLGQNLSFRIDLNARENFLETAQRRDSILRLAQLISYSPKRNVPGNGLLKITAISTTDSIIDSLGNNLSNTTIGWNDPTNSNWYSQFISILNSTLSGASMFGKPSDQNILGGILAQQYKINSASTTDVPVFGFTKNINGVSMSFEVVSTSFSGKTFAYEEPPRPGNQFSLIYQNDNQGNSSANTGFFCQFKQGKLGISNFDISAPVPNEIIGVNISDINDTDVWLWQLTKSGSYSKLWTKVESEVGNNVIYNSLSNRIRDFYSVTSRANDQIDLNFADGSFGNLPKGQFNLYYRQSNGLSYSITPQQMSGIVVSIPYVNKSGQQQTLQLTLSLQYTVNNSSGTESNASIRSNAPQTYYTQNRMVTAEDYNIAPLRIGSEILKVKSIARVTSGVSKYFELSDVSGKYSRTNIFASDGVVYKDLNEQSLEFSFTSQNDIYTVIKKQLAPIVSSTSLRSFYFDQYARPAISAKWVQVNKASGQGQGYFADTVSSQPVTVGSFSNSSLLYIVPGALIKFRPPAGKFFLPDGTIVSSKTIKTVNYLWATVIQVVGDGSNYGAGALDTGVGPVTFSTTIDSTAVPVEIIPKFVNSFSIAFESEIINLCLIKRNFGLSFDQYLRTWQIIEDNNIDLISPFSLEYQNNVDNANRDSSWIIAFTWTGIGYKVRYRLNNFIFESDRETSFFIDTNTVNYDFTTDTVVKDKISVLSINSSNTSTAIALAKDYVWQIDGPIIESDGYVNPKRVQISFYDHNNSGQISDPDAFNNIVDPKTVNSITGANDKFVYFKLQPDGVTYNLVDSANFVACPNPAYATTLINEATISPVTGDLFYFYDAEYNVVNSYNSIDNTWVYTSDTSLYSAYPGRDTLKFQYVHNSGQERRIDPSKSNIMDVYLLTSAYDTAFRNWLTTGGAGTRPLPPTSSALESNYSSSLESIKTISDEIIYQPVNYKVLFGPTADINLQATFKVVQSPTSTLSSNDIITTILTAIDNFFSLENWEFGKSFYFSELSAYVMNLLTPDITNFVIVPVNPNSNFGSLYEIACQSNEIFISGATASNIKVISAITASQLNSTNIVTYSGT